MKKLIIICALAVLILTVSSKTQAGTTYVDVVDAGSGQPNTYFYSGGDPLADDVYRWYDEDWGWTHTFNPPEFPEVTINWAKLEIYAFDSDLDEVDLIEGDGISLGQLNGSPNETWLLTTFFESIPLDELLDGTMNMWMNIDAVDGLYGPLPNWAVTLESSTLTIDYDVILPDPPTQTTPAPGAILLGSIGIGLVGWLRRRRTL